MKFIVDAQLPRSLAVYLHNQGFDVIHTSDLPDGNDTTDAEIIRLSFADGRVVISKDGDFYNSFSASKEPNKLLYVRTGNISNLMLLDLIRKNLHSIIGELQEGDVVEIDQRYLIALH